MPELPEVETVLRGVAPYVTGEVFQFSWADDHPRFTDAGRVAGRKVKGVERRGKYLLFHLDDQCDLVVHLGMTGVLALVPEADISGLAAQRPVHTRAEWVTGSGQGLRLVDPRKFGRVSLVPSAGPTGIPTLDQLGPEPLGPAFDIPAFHERLNSSRSGIKAQLLSQKVIAGAGNIYVDEALWDARIHPLATGLSLDEAGRVHVSLVKALLSGIERRGTTLRDYRAADGTSGSNQHALKCYGRTGVPCERCKTPLVSGRIAGRGTTYCPVCQVLSSKTTPRKISNKIKSANK